MHPLASRWVSNDRTRSALDGVVSYRIGRHRSIGGRRIGPSRQAVIAHRAKAPSDVVLVNSRTREECFMPVRSWPKMVAALSLLVALFCSSAATAQFQSFDNITENMERVVSTADGGRSLYTIYVDRNRHQMVAELPRNFENQRIFIATTITGGSAQTGWQWRDTYAYWKRHNENLMLIAPNIRRQARGQRDAELRSSVERTYTDRVLLTTRILGFGPGGGPIINLNDVLLRQAPVLASLSGNHQLAEIGQIKAFPQNIEIPVTMPMAGGQLTSFHYSISMIPRTNYRPREADERIGYFMTVFKDFSRNEAGGDQFVRYINRWHLEKRDPQLRQSPPVEPIVFYIEHTVPIRYRRFVRDGILEWNRAFEKIGFIDAIEVRQQDARTGAYMDVYPEDVRYNFFRWITSERAFAMGPSRVNPETGQILDANIIFDDAMLKLWAVRYREMIENFGLEGLAPEAMKFIEDRPLWNPLTRHEEIEPDREAILNDPDLTDEEKADLLGEPAPASRSRLMQRVVQMNDHCDFGMSAALQMQTANLALQIMSDTLLGDQSDAPTLDGVPEEYLGAMLKYVVMHEVGHTLGLRHNFKAASWLSLDEIVEKQGEAAVASVMDYAGTFIPPTGKEDRGDWAMPTLGPYDIWAIEYGYTLNQQQLPEIASRGAQPELLYATDEDRAGPDPLVDVWILGADPLEWAQSRLDLVSTMRERILDKAVEDGQSWHLLRRAYEQTLGEHLGALRVASRFVGGAYVHRDRKGDPNARDPYVPVEPERQREALAFVIDNAFHDDRFDLRPEVMRKLVPNRFRHWGASSGNVTFPIHNRVAQIQSFAMLYLMNPGTLQRVYDNELRVETEEDMLTLPELMGSVVEAIYTELENGADGRYTEREPMISSLRRNLQSEMTDRLIDLALDPRGVPSPVPTLARFHLRNLDRSLSNILDGADAARVDTYSLAHLQDIHERISSALNAIKVAR
ncbi:MAG: DUF5117 domain-containing protein [Phycisphaerales bacterium]|nr:MAG: DUF5117 domain-containing protein [Phycisphaerales bacterium]